MERVLKAFLLLLLDAATTATITDRKPLIATHASKNAYQASECNQAVCNFLADFVRITHKT